MYPQVTLFSETIPTYFIFLSFLSCGLIFYLRTRALAQRLDVRIALNVGAIVLIAGFVGARLFHVFYEYPRYYINNPLAVFYYWQGGFVFYGGVLAALLIGAWYLKRQQQSFLAWLDFYTPVIAVGYGLGRISCFLAGCCYGRYCEMFAGPHPVQLYVTAWELATYAGLIFLERKSDVRKYTGRLAGIYAVTHGLGRIMMEFFRDDDRGAMILGLSISTWLSLILVLVGVWLIRRKRTISS